MDFNGHYQSYPNIPYSGYSSASSPSMYSSQTVPSDQYVNNNYQSVPQAPYQTESYSQPSLAPTYSSLDPFAYTTNFTSPPPITTNQFPSYSEIHRNNSPQPLDNSNNNISNPPYNYSPSSSQSHLDTTTQTPVYSPYSPQLPHVYSSSQPNLNITSLDPSHYTTNFNYNSTEPQTQTQIPSYISPPQTPMNIQTTNGEFSSYYSQSSPQLAQNYSSSYTLNAQQSVGNFNGDQNVLDYSSYLNTQINEQAPLDQSQIENFQNLGITFAQSSTPSPMKLNGSRIPDLMISIQSDPRYRRLLFKYAPKKTTKKGLIQYAKNKVDPSKIPVFGFFCDIFRSGKLGDYKHELSDMQHNTGHTSDVSNVTMTSLSGCIDAQLTKQSVKTGIGMLFNWIPIISALPGGGFKMLFYKGSEKIVNKQHLTDTIESDVLEDYKVTKAFLLYLGHPANNDELYSRWENNRLALKEIFGSKREENLYTMSYDVWKGEHESQNQSDAPPVPLLLLLWHVYHCQREQYYSRLMRAFRHQSPEDIAKKEREEDAKWLAFDPSFDHDPHVILLSSMQEDAATSVLLNEFQNSLQFEFLKSHDGSPDVKLEWWVRLIVRHFIEKKQIWAYMEDDQYKTIRAVILWQSPNCNDPIDPLGKFTKLRARSTIGKEYLATIDQVLEEVANLRTFHLQNVTKRSATLCYFGVWHADSDDFISYDRYLITLISNVVNMLESDVVVYAQSNIDRADMLKEAGFNELPNTLNPLSTFRGFLYDRDNYNYNNNNDNNNYQSDVNSGYYYY